MKKTVLAVCSAALLGGGMLSGAVSAADEQFESDTDKLSYSLGLMVAERVLKRYGEDINTELFIEALEAQRQGNDTRISLTDAGTALQEFEQKAAEEKAMAAKESSDQYLAENAEREGVSVTESGLQWEVLSAAEGDKPTLEDTVSVHYVGTLLDGSEFDSSIARGQPAQFPLKGVIPGWTEGLQLMTVGSKYRFVIPSELAYGKRGAGQSIGPDETLVFEVELLEIIK